jgi:hypothetical protein
MWGAASQQKLSSLRVFRDEVLSRTGTGRHYVDGIYANSVEIALLLLRERELSDALRLTIEQLLPAISRLNAGHAAALSPEQVAGLEALCRGFEAAAVSWNLKALAREARQDLRDEQALREIGFTVK